MIGKDAPRGELGDVAGHGLPGEQMHGDRVGAEGVEHDEPERAVGLTREGQARVAQHDVHVSAALREEGEEPRVSRDVSHGRVDLEERDSLARLPVGGDGSHAQADGSHARRLSAGSERREDLPDGAGRVIVGQRPVRILRVLHPVHGGAVEEPTEPAVVRQQDPMDGEEAPLRQGNLAGELRLGPGRDQEQRAEREREARRPVRGEEAEQHRNAHRHRRAHGARAETQDIAREGNEHERDEADGDAIEEVGAARRRSRPSGCHEGGRGGEGQRVLEERVEDHGGDEPGQHAPDDPARGHPEIERGQPGGLGPLVVQTGVAHPRGKKEGGQMEHGELRLRLLENEQERHGHEEKRQKPREQRRGHEPARREGEDEAQQIEGERHDPEQWNGGDVAREIARDAEEQARRDSGERDPAQRATAVGRVLGHRRRRRLRAGLFR